VKISGPWHPKQRIEWRHTDCKEESTLPGEGGVGSGLWGRWLKSSTCSSRALVPWLN
jgi:hypothetical protein